jgi:hypothetical protein
MLAGERSSGAGHATDQVQPGWRKNSSDCSSGRDRRRSEAASTAAAVDENARIEVTRCRGSGGPSAPGQLSPRRAFPRCRRAGRRGRIPCCPSSGRPCARRCRPSRARLRQPTSCALVETMAEHLEPAGVGGDGAPDRRAVTTAEVDPVRPAGLAAAAWTSATVVPAPADSWPPSASTSLTPASRRN